MSMSAETKTANSESRWKLSLDSWAVVVALLAALLIRAGVFKHVPW
jgi:hypothetical protein